MANKPLKSIKFPGLSDTYTVPQVDATLTTQGAAADAKAVGDALSDLSVETDKTLSVADKPADAKKVGDEISDLKADIEYILPRKVNQPLSAGGQPINGINGQILRTKGDGSTEWASVGLPTDEQTAEAVEAWLNEHPEATTTVEDGSLSEQKFTADVIAKLNNIVSVRDYGAVGNDQTDDTEAIQRCIDKNPRSTIYFPGGVYRISSTIHCRGRKYGGTYLFLGGAVIKANADMTAMFYFDDTYSGNIDTAVEGGLFGIFGGRLDGNKHADVCIKNDSWFIEVNNTYMLSFLVAGIWDEGGGLSSYHRIKMDLARTDEAWSEGTTAGIIAGCVDSFFTDVQIQNCHYGVRLRGGGNTFNGCYFFSRTNTTLHPEAAMEGYGIYIENDSNSAALVTFDNCYFDSNIYAIYSVGTKVWNVTLNSCFFYITHDSYFNAEKVFLLGGSTNVNLRAKGIECHSSTTCDMLLGRQSYNITDNKNFLIEQNKPNTHINNIFNIVNLDEGRYSFNNVKNKPTFLIGAISNANITNALYKLTMTIGASSSEFLIKQVGRNFTIISENIGTTTNFFSIIIDKTPKSAVALENITYHPIYLKSETATFTGDVHVELKPLGFKPASCYFYNDTYRAGSFTISDPFIVNMYTPPVVPEKKTIYFIGDSITAGTGCDNPYHKVLQEMATADGLNVSCLNYGIGSTGYYWGISSGTVDVGGGVEGDGTPQEITSQTRILDIIRSLPSSIPYAVLFAGTNDYGSNVPLTDADRTSGEVTTFRAMFQNTLLELSAKTSNILVIAPIRRENGENVNGKNRKLSEYRDAIKEIGIRFGVLYYDGYDMPFNPTGTTGATNKTAFMPDGLHPNDAGHRKIAACLYEKFKALIA